MLLVRLCVSLSASTFRIILHDPSLGWVRELRKNIVGCRPDLMKRQGEGVKDESAQAKETKDWKGRQQGVQKRVEEKKRR